MDSEPSSGQFSVTDLRQQKIVTLIVYISAGGCVQHMYDKVTFNHDKHSIKKSPNESISLRRVERV